MTRARWFAVLFLALILASTATLAQRGFDRRGRGRRGYGGGYGYGGGGSWRTDYPDSDLNFTYRLHQLTSMEVNPGNYDDRRGVPSWQPDKEFSEDAFTFVRIKYSSGYNGREFSDPHDYPGVMELTDPELVNYPFIYMLECGSLVFSDEEVEALRRYLLNGGFLMVDDFWGEAEWFNFYREIKRVFPDREPIELSIDDPIFHTVFDLKEKPQIPSINVALAGRPYGITWEREDAKEVHFKALYDDQGRMMAIICHNTDLGDGWEREGEDEWYFHEFSEKKAYPMGINIVVYAMTH
jgi:Domain of unknown function (DUF4159)